MNTAKIEWLDYLLQDASGRAQIAQSWSTNRKGAAVSPSL
jgi:hypothetical protein